MSTVVDSLVKDKVTAKPQKAFTFLIYFQNYDRYIEDNVYKELLANYEEYISKISYFIENINEINYKDFLVNIDINPAVIKFKNRLNELSKLKDGWDDEHASRIFPEVIDNIKSALKINQDDNLWQHWIAYPDTNGTITLMKKDGSASVSIGIKEYSFYGLKNGKELSGNKLPFETDRFVKVLKTFS